MGKYTIGLDLGVANIGWSIFNNETEKIENFGVRTFNQSNDAKERREVRNTRRRLKRRKNRVKDVAYILNRIDFPTERTVDENLIVKRYIGINQKIEKQDISNILFYMLTHRGYIPFNDEEVNIVNLDGLLPCEYYYNLYKNNIKYRGVNQTVSNKDNINEIRKLLQTQQQYYKEITNDIIADIIETFQRKREFWEGPGSINQLTPYGRFKNEDDVEEYLHNKKLNPKYEKYLFEDLIGKCEIDLNEKCAPVFNFYAEYFNFLNDFINISFESLDQLTNTKYIKQDGINYKLNKMGLETIKNYVLNSKRISIDKLFLDTLGTNIENVSGMRKNKEGKPEFSLFKNYLYIKRFFEKDNLKTNWIEDIDLYNKIVYYLTICPGIVEIKNMISSDPSINYEFTDEDYNRLSEIKKNKNSELKYHSLSEKVLIRAINDMLKLEMNFMQVRRKLDYDKEAREYFKKNYTNREGNIPLIDEKHVDNIIASPQVKKTLRQAIKIINAIIIQKKSLPGFIAIESTKELNGSDRKKTIEKEQRQQEVLRKESSRIIIDNFGEEKVSNNNIERVMLYQEVNGHCMYCNCPLNLNDVINGIIQVEHILPQSKSFDNSYNNKTLACIDCNNNKGNKTPYYFLSPKGMYDSFKERVEKLKISEDKKNNLLFTGNIDKYSVKFINRNLRDTAYATTELVKQIKLYNNYLETIVDNQKVKTLSTPGQLTNKLRDRHELKKERDTGLAHHAVDASIVASITNTKIGQLIIDAQNNNDFWIKNKFNISNKIDYLLNVSLKDNIDEIKKINEDNIKVSVQTIKNCQGKLSNSNIYKVFEKNNQYYKIDQIDDIYKLDFSNESDRKLFEKLLDEKDSTATLLCYDNDKETFRHIRDIYEKCKKEKGNPFINYVIDTKNIKYEEFNYLEHGIRVSSKKQNSPIIKRLRYYTKINEPMLLNKENIILKNKNKIALDNLSQLCTRVYLDIDNNKFVFLPIYSISTNLKTKEIDENNNYYKLSFNKYIGNKNVKHIIDLYNGDYIEILKSDNSIIKGYYQCFHKTNNKICLKNGSYFTRSDREFTLYSFDILGNKFKRLTCKAY